MSGISLSRTTVLTVVLLVEVAVIGFFVARWYSRRWGWKSTFGRIRRYVGATFADLFAPAVQLYRFGRNVRLIAAQLTDPELGGALRLATGDAQDQLAGEPDSSPFAARISSGSVSLGISGLHRVTPGRPWKARENWWQAPRSALTVGPGSGEDFDDVVIAPVVIGAEHGVVTVLDLLRAPGVIEVIGPNRPVGSLICAVAAQLASGLNTFEPMDVVVASGLHPRFSGPRPIEVLRDLDARSRAEGYQDRFTVLLCGPLNDAEADLLTALIPRLPLLRVMLAGPYDGRRWKLPITESGRIEAPELGLFTDSTPVERAVARALSAGTATRPVVETDHPEPASRREARRAGAHVPPPAAVPLPPEESAFFAEPEYQEYEGYQESRYQAAEYPTSEYPAAQYQYQPDEYRSSYPDDAYAPPPAEPSTSEPASAPSSAPRSSPWDLDEPDPDSPATGEFSVSAISASNPASPDAEDGNRRPRH
ncbi:hypothetical protein [Kineosporia babensis]|uniref:Uncharacterized protein n=1 Tax=Kineosporia babensis TaxID=499548 RepID=A0A9X1SSG4_9ACTN|nr:hypothetical protein [Kineosporia babensis]MCD5310256.1 hypothetical protein [Kineosporia babensis]